MNDQDGAAKFPPGRGFAWRGDWQARLASRLFSIGYGSLLSYLSARPNATFGELVAELGPGDFAPVQLQEAMIAEAEDRNGVGACAKYMLVRFLRAVPNGWPLQRTRDALMEVRHALVDWECALPERFREAARKVVLSMLRDQGIPEGWIPNGIDDDYLAPHLSLWCADEHVKVSCNE